MSQKVDTFTKRFIPLFLKSSLAVASLLVRYVNEEKAQKERGYKAPTYNILYGHALFVVTLSNCQIVKLVKLEFSDFCF